MPKSILTTDFIILNTKAKGYQEFLFLIYDNMIIKDQDSNEQYFLDLYEKWWHFMLLGLSWFLPHRAYLHSKKVRVVEFEKKRKGDIGLGIAIGFGIILSSLLQTIKIYKIPEEFHWLGIFIVYPMVVISLMFLWRYIKNNANGKENINKDKYIIVKIKWNTLDSLTHCYSKILLSFFFFVLLVESIKFDLIMIIIVVFLSWIFLLLVIITAGTDANINSSDGKILKVDYNQKSKVL